MSGRGLRRAGLVCTSALLGLLTLQTPVADPPQLRLTIDLSEIGVELSSAMRVDLEREITVRLLEDDCFAEVRAKAPQPIEERDLVLEVRVERYREQTSFESSVHGNATRGLAEPVLSTAEIVGDVTLRLIQVSPRLELRKKSGQRHVSWRPPSAGDAMGGARRRWVENVGKMAHRLACRGGADKLNREIERQRRESR